MATVQAFLRHASLSDAANREHAAELVASLGGWRDRELIAELLAIARAPTTLSTVRDEAVLAPGRTVFASLGYREDLLRMPVNASGGWSATGRLDGRAVVGAPLGVSEVATRRTALGRVRDATGLAPRTRRPAGCVAMALPDEIADLEPVPAGRITLTWICGNMFRIRNT